MILVMVSLSMLGVLERCLQEQNKELPPEHPPNYAVNKHGRYCTNGFKKR
jgi:hypothetical protein